MHESIRQEGSTTELVAAREAPHLRSRVARESPHPRVARRFQTIGLALCVGLVVGHRVVLEPGVVGLVHDWSIPPFREQSISFVVSMFHGWFRWGLGAPVVYPTEYPFRFALAALSFVGMSGAVASKLIVVGMPAAAFASATYLGRRIGYSYFGAWMCGAFYSLDPVMLNKLVSGQAAYLLGYAALPLVVGVLFEERRRRNPVLLGLALGGVLGLAATEIQLGLVGLGLVVAFGVFARASWSRKAVIFAVAVVVLLLVEAPAVVGIAHGISDIEGLGEFQNRSTWLLANTLAPLDALRLIGYLTQYDVSSLLGWSGPWQVFSWLCVGLALVGVARSPSYVRLSALVLLPLTFAVVCGAKLPVLAGAMTWLFDHVSFLQVFRELYHVMAIPSLYYALGIGSCAVWIGRLHGRTRYLAGAALVIAVAGYVEPMFSGDIAGWLVAAPYDRYLEPANSALATGNTRVAWFPMDQPLGFDDRGAGVDPMSITPRGSLWQYSLEWPLRAIDMAARERNTAELRDGLRILSVGDAVERDRFYSRLEMFGVFAASTNHVFLRPLRLDASLGKVTAFGPALRAYHLDAPAPREFIASRFALAPNRFAIVSRVAASGTPVFSFSHAPAGLPFDMYVDPADRDYEALMLAHLAGALPRWTFDDGWAFGGSDLWWYRRAYAEAARVALVVGRGTSRMSVSRPLSQATAVVAWIATPAGGRLEVRCGNARGVFDTGGEWEHWHSQAVSCGALARGQEVVLRALDPGAEVALRGATLVESSQLHAARSAYAAELRAADRVLILPVRPFSRVRLVRAGRGRELGALPSGQLRLALQVAPAESQTVRVLDANGYLLGWGQSARGNSRLVIPLESAGGRAHLQTAGSAQLPWRLERGFGEEAKALPARAGAPADARLVMYGEAFDTGWKAGVAATHLPTAYGTNAYIARAALRTVPEVWYQPARWFALAFVIGGLALLAGLVTAGALMFGRTSMRLSQKT